MSTINNLSGGYYQLNNMGSGSTSNSATGTNATDALLQAMNAMNNGSNGADPTSSDAFMLDLSPQAQQFLNGAGSSGASANIFGANGNFILNTLQQQKISAILTKYKDAPYNQDTFNQIQNDLQAAGLGADTLSMKDQTQSFDPAMVLINALNGTSDSSALLGSSASNGNEQAKSSHYMGSILKQWQNISTTYHPGDTTAAAGA